ncbi:hydrogenase 4 subunit F [Patescibacteria group bacterium]|nr:MAG: hydrogenase 4 subunit F [Patescibacteria group bacterium]
MVIGIIILVVTAGLPFLFKQDWQVRLGALLGTAVTAVTVGSVAVPVLWSGSGWSNAWWNMDPFAALMTCLILFVYVTALLVSNRYLGHEYRAEIVSLSQVKMYFSLIHIFVLSMLMAVTTNNSMLVWIALEGTTLSSTFLVGLYKKRTSIEAAWKYIVLCSTGITLGLVGVLLVNYSAHAAGFGHDIFTLTSLRESAAGLSPEIIKWAFIFLFIGFGTKVGLVPMHTWLPDAHSKAPSPISALFSGILLNVALAVIIRFKQIVDGVLGGSEWTNNFFLTFGMLSVMLPALALLIQNNYKRMLAYSSIEHMGLISLAVALPPVGMVAAVIHMIGHTLTKSALFFGAGEFLLKWKTTKIEKIRNLMRVSPYSGTLFLVGVLAIIAAPISVLFASEYVLFGQLFLHHWILALVALVSLSLIAFAMLRLTFSLLYGRSDNSEEMERETWNVTHTIMTVQLILVFGLTFVLTSPAGLEFIGTIVKSVN